MAKKESKHRFRITIPEICLKKSALSKKQQQVIISCFLAQMNLPIARSRVIYLSIPYLGKFFTHGNKRNVNKLRYFREYNAKRKYKIKVK